MSRTRRAIAAGTNAVRQMVAATSRWAVHATSVSIRTVKWAAIELAAFAKTVARLLRRGVVNGMKSQRIRLVLAALLFFGWLSWLGYSALAKNRGPIVSRVQAAAAAHAVVGEVTVGADGKPAQEVKIVENFAEGGPAAGSEIYLVNGAEAKGFDGPGQYLLLLSANSTARGIPINGKEVALYSLVGLQRSPGYKLAGTGSPTIYKLTPEIRTQAEKLFRR